MFRYSPHWSFILLVGVLSSGCGGAKIHPVGGKVVFADTGEVATDLAGYHVELESIDGQLDGRSASATGQIQKDGTFRITTLKENDGALLGKHRVIIAPPHTEGDTASKPFLIDKRFMSYESSNLTVTIEPKKNDITLTVERRKP